MERRAAEAFERRRRQQAQREIAARKQARAAFAGHAPLTLTAACARYFEERGRFLAAPDTVLRDLERATAHFGPQTPMAAITDADVAAWVARRRGERRKGDRTAPLVSPATVNRSTVDALRKVFAHARKAWRLQFPAEPAWNDHRLREPDPRIADIPEADEARIVAALAEGYREYWQFAIETGLRLAECRLRWSQVDMDGARATLVQKGGRPRIVVLSARAMAILSTCRGKDPDWVFTYICRRRGGAMATKRLLKARYPVTVAGMSSARRQAMKRLGLRWKFHDTRHTLATRLLRATGNLKLAQQQLGHARIETTARHYAHVLEDDIRDGLAAMNAAKPAAAARKTGSTD